MAILVGIRDSKLSHKQFEEVAANLNVSFEALPVKTTGDHDLKTSLRLMDKTDFFTREIDQMLLEGKCRISIHSAKDLPAPLPKGLKLIALTQGQDPSDTLVFREGESLETLRRGARVGSSSKRRDQVIRKLRPDLLCTEVRGTVEKRLEMLSEKTIDALVVAEAALIRLKLTHLNRIPLPGFSAPLQGQLAVMAREGDQEMEVLFASLDTRRNQPGKTMSQTTLYLGLDPKNYRTTNKLIHCPIIQTVARPFDAPKMQSIFQDIPDYTHFIFTSQVGVQVFFDCLAFHGFSPEEVAEKEIVTVGTATAAAVEKWGGRVTQIADEETQEGIIQMLATQDLDRSYIFLPCSSLSRPDLAHFLMIRRIRHQLCYLYDTKVREPAEKPDLEAVDEIVFTSPSTVDAFQKIFGNPPKNKKLTSIGPITQVKLNSLFTN